MIPSGPIFTLVLIILSCVSTRDVTYGNFSATVTEYRLCKKKLQSECADWDISIESPAILNMKIVVNKEIQKIKGRVLTSINGMQLLRIQINNPCDNLLLKSLFKNIFNMTEDCKILRGNYSSKLDMNVVSQLNFGNKFLLGQYSFKSLFYTNECNFICSVLTMMFK